MIACQLSVMRPIRPRQKVNYALCLREISIYGYLRNSSLFKRTYQAWQMPGEVYSRRDDDISDAMRDNMPRI